MKIFKVLTLDEAAEFDRSGEAPLSAADAADGYVHLSTAAQLLSTLEKHFADQRAVRVLAVEPDGLGEALRWEPARGGELFPHFYGQLRGQHVAGGWIFGRDHAGKFRLPREMLE